MKKNSVRIKSPWIPFVGITTVLTLLGILLVLSVGSTGVIYVGYEMRKTRLIYEKFMGKIEEEEKKQNIALDTVPENPLAQIPEGTNTLPQETQKLKLGNEEFNEELLPESPVEEGKTTPPEPSEEPRLKIGSDHLWQT